MFLGLFYVAYRNRRLVDYLFNQTINNHAQVRSTLLSADGLSDRVRVDVIATGTTTAHRLHTVHFAIESILLQTVRPHRVELYLSDSIPSESLPKSLTRLFALGLTVHFVEDVGPHTKLLYALRDFPDAHLLTYDDDFYYPPHALEGMLAIAAQVPGAIVGNWVRRLRVGLTGKVLRARSGRLVTPTTLAKSIEAGSSQLHVGHDLFAYGTSGVLYPPRAFDERVFDTATFRRLCPTEDDVWFKAMAMLNGTPVAAAPLGHTPRHHVIQGSQRVALRHANYSGGSRATKNQIRAVFDHFDLYTILSKSR